MIVTFYRSNSTGYSLRSTIHNLYMKVVVSEATNRVATWKTTNISSIITRAKALPTPMFVHTNKHSYDLPALTKHPESYENEKR